jgi:hypothetical protein
MKFLLLALIALSFNSFANEKGNGGDECEREIQVIQEEIQNWIYQGGSDHLILPENISLENYNEKMLSILNSDVTKLSCTSEKVFILKSEKTCINMQEEDGGYRIICNEKKFKEMTDSAKYKIVHHEYAGIAGFEVNNGEEKSQYFITNQLSKFMEKVLVTKLAIKPNDEMIYLDDNKLNSSTVDDILYEGYTIEATVSRNNGFHFNPGQSNSGLRKCHLSLKRSVESKSIVKNGRTFFLTTNFDEANNSSMTADDKVIYGIKYYRTFRVFDITLSKLKSTCRGSFTFKVVDRNSPIEL